MGEFNFNVIFILNDCWSLHWLLKSWSIIYWSNRYSIISIAMYVPRERSCPIIKAGQKVQNYHRYTIYYNLKANQQLKNAWRRTSTHVIYAVIYAHKKRNRSSELDDRCLTPRVTYICMLLVLYARYATTKARGDTVMNPVDKVSREFYIVYLQRNGVASLGKRYTSLYEAPWKIKRPCFSYYQP